ncbi:hypothetical protein ACTHQN_13615 [Curtobacterium flaccumfaciens]|uniref:hypothetical protein n=1 Tax=Curtobacterium flaccumfaciens TaxID=2035 RepID=UPI003F7EA3C8
MTSYVFGAFVIIVATLTAKRPHIGIVLSLALYLFVPAAASEIVVGELLASAGQIYPATFLVLAVFAARLVVAGRSLGGEVIRSYPLLVILVLFGVTATVSNTLGGGDDGLAFLVNQAFVPIAAYFLTLEAARTRAGSAKWIARAFVGLAVVQGLIALAVRNGIIAQPYAEQLQIYRWFALGEDRALGTTDNALVLSTVLAVAVPLTLLIRQPLARIGCLAVLLSGVLLTESRVGIAIALAGVVVVVIRSNVSAVARGAFLGACALGALGLLLSPLGAGVLERISDDGGSSTARAAAFKEVWGLVGDSLLLGGGTGRSIDVALSAGLGTSFENPFLMYAFDYGFVIAFLYFGVQLVVVLRGLRGQLGAAGTAAGLIGFVSIQSFSSVSTSNTVGGIIWIVFALAAAHASVRARALTDGFVAAPSLERPSSVLRSHVG